MSGINRDDWLAAFNEATNGPLPASDALTILEFAELIGRERNMAARQMQKMVAAGKATRTTKQIRRQDGGVITVPAYRLTKEGAMRDAETLDGCDVIDPSPEPDDEDTFHVRPDPRPRRRSVPKMRKRDARKKGRRLARRR